MNVFRDFLDKEVQRIGYREFVRRSEGEFTEGALQGWMRGAFPGPTHQEVIAKIVDVPVEKIKDLVWRSERAREEERLARLFRPPVRPRRPRRSNGGAAAQAAPTGRGSRPAQPLPAAGRRPIIGARKSAKRQADSTSSVKLAEPRVILGSFGRVRARPGLLSTRPRAA